MKSGKYPGIRRVKRLKSTVSTQSFARRLADGGAAAWTLVRADRQSRGRGRLDRRWSSGSGGLYFSLILRPALKPTQLANLGLKCGRLCAKALREISGLSIRIKLPNDVLARPLKGSGGYKKICGILIEASGCAHAVEWVIIGIGVNVANRIPPSLPLAASLNRLTGTKHDPERVLRALLRALRGGLKSL